MNVIYTQELNIAEIYEEAVINITEQISNVKLEKVQHINVNNDDVTSIVMYSVGIYNSVTICCLESDLLYEIVLNMGIEEVLLKEEMELYIKEYVNIVCGRAISKINNLIGRASKFTVPDVHKGVYVDKNLHFYDNKEELFYKSRFGILKILIAYKSSNDNVEYLYAN